MSAAQTPADEQRRLAELETFRILDTMAEDSFDAITLLASQICRTPIALISLIDNSRQWFKSRVGLGTAETSRDLAFCAHAITQPDEVMVVRDATQDVRFAANALVLGDPNIRFYAGAPIVTASGNALGTLCVIDRVPRDLNADQERALAALSTQVMALLELRRTVDTLTLKQIEVERLMRQRETFMATVSHEIRSPLTAVAGFLEMAESERRLSTSERREIVAAAGRQAQDVIAILDDLLIAAKVESETMRVESVALDLVSQIYQALEGVDQVFASSVHVDTRDRRVLGDPVRLRQILRNLLTNAQRYGGPDVRVAVVPGDVRCAVEVSDDGPGVPGSETAQVFESFHTASGSRYSPDSIGLGLPISKRLAEMMGGALRYSRREGRSVFTLEVPSAPQPAIVASH